MTYEKGKWYTCPEWEKDPGGGSFAKLDSIRKEVTSTLVYFKECIGSGEYCSYEDEWSAENLRVAKYEEYQHLLPKDHPDRIQNAPDIKDIVSKFLKP